jgi:hypothetical protein
MLCGVVVPLCCELWACCDLLLFFANDLRLPLLLHCRALADRLKWAISEFLGGKEACTPMQCNLFRPMQCNPFTSCC